ncbi:hypothetical protein LJB83_00670 [Clostridia bacterium OttesenSCG-928-F22]|nr:hypothetical protein [Clostridia bacterium OttesenSCG-928-F22]
MGIRCLFGHKWNGCKCSKCGEVRNEGHNYQLQQGKCEEKCTICGAVKPVAHVWNGQNCARCNAPNPNVFYLEVGNKYTDMGGVFAEGKVEYGQLSIGDSVYVYSADGQLKYDKIAVSALRATNISTQSIHAGEKYAAIMLNGLRNFGDIEYRDIISKEKLEVKAEGKEEPVQPEKTLPQAKTYNHADRNTHITMATNDIASMCASGGLANNREWVRNVGQDLYDAHGFGAMQEVFINVKNRYPAAQSQLSQTWDGVGGWAD